MKIRKSVKDVMIKTIKKYDDSLDHGKTHIADVVKNVWRYVRFYQLSIIEIEILLMAAVFHDIGLTMGGRKDHEIVAKQVVLADKDLKQLFNKEEIDIIGDCCLHHRTSNNDQNLPLLSKILSDSDNSVDIETVIMRCVATRMGKTSDRSSEFVTFVREDVLSYLDMKHGSKGYKQFYLPLPSHNAESWISSKRIIDNREPELFTLIEKYIQKLW